MVLAGRQRGGHGAPPLLPLGGHARTSGRGSVTASRYGIPPASGRGTPAVKPWFAPVERLGADRRNGDPCRSARARCDPLPEGQRCAVRWVYGTDVSPLGLPGQAALAPRGQPAAARSWLGLPA